MNKLNAICEYALISGNMYICVQMKCMDVNCYCCCDIGWSEKWYISIIAHVITISSAYQHRVLNVFSCFVYIFLISLIFLRPRRSSAPWLPLSSLSTTVPCYTSIIWKGNIIGEKLPKCHPIYAGILVTVLILFGVFGAPSYFNGGDSMHSNDSEMDRATGHLSPAERALAKTKSDGWERAWRFFSRTVPPPTDASPTKSTLIDRIRNAI